MKQVPCLYIKPDLSFLVVAGCYLYVKNIQLSITQHAKDLHILEKNNILRK